MINYLENFEIFFVEIFSLNHLIDDDEDMYVMVDRIFGIRNLMMKKERRKKNDDDDGMVCVKDLCNIHREFELYRVIFEVNFERNKPKDRLLLMNIYVKQNSLV
jgi:hypothetical protein